MKRMLLAGEAMGLFIAGEEGSLSNVSHFSSAIAGAEYNVAVGLTRLEHRVSYLTKVGDDPFGEKIRNALTLQGIDTSLVQTDASHATGFMFKGKTAKGDPDIAYFRKGSAASTLSAADVEAIDFSSFDAVHVTGILAGISSSACEAAECMMRRAKAAGCVVFFDPNLRPQLWKDKQTMVETTNRLASLADWVLPGYKEGDVLTGFADPRKIADFYLSQGVTGVVVKTGEKGAFAATSREQVTVPSFVAREIVDTVGAGDGFACGIISGVLEGLPLYDTVLRANAIGTIQIMNPGDNEGLPTREVLASFMETTPQNV